jgi:NAD(P)H-hydrate epimerase
MREVDRVAIELGLSLTRMMENAGGALAWMACWMLGGDVAARRITVLSGPGGNGGGGLVAARSLIGWGANVDVRLAAAPGRARADPARATPAAPGDERVDRGRRRGAPAAGAVHRRDPRVQPGG